MKTSRKNGTTKNEMTVILLDTPRDLPACEGTPSQELCKIARHQINKFISLVPEALQNGNLEVVNNLRVTARRLEQILDLLYAKPRPRLIKKLHQQLKTCRRTLGNLRNYDALLEMVDQSLALNTPSNTKVWMALKDYLQDCRLQRGQKTLEKLGRINLTSSYLKLKRDLDSETLFEPPSEDGAMIKAATDRGNDLNRRIMKSLDDRWHDFEQAVEKSRRDPREEVIHQMRIAAKRFRYLTEAMEKLHIERSSETLAWLRTLQDIVGQWHDRELLAHAMSDMLDQPRFRNVHHGLRADVRKIIRHNRETKEKLERKFSRMISHSRHYHGTKEWVAQLLANENGVGASNSVHH